MADKIRILFVDDVDNILSALRRMLRPMRSEWEMSFANGGIEALKCLDKKHHDVIVSDVRMPGMSGVELLENVRRVHPHMIRIVLSGQADRESVLAAAGPTHQYLSKPCSLETLKAVLGRVIAMRKLLNDEKIADIISAIESVSPLPRLYDELLEKIILPEASIESVARIISMDVGMSGKILQLVNSSFFGPPRRVSGPTETVEALGMDVIKPLVLSNNIFLPLDVTVAEEFEMETLRKHSVAVAGYARKIAQEANADNKTINASFMAGMLHDVGKIIFADQFADDYRSAIDLANKEGVGALEAENRAIGVTHAQAGAYLLGIWSLPDQIVEAVAYHHRPTECPDTDGFSALTAVHIANALDKSEDVDVKYLYKIGLADHLPAWQEICLEKETANV
jgi:putative nucleotidyltransferase with HDIG domain